MQQRTPVQHPHGDNGLAVKMTDLQLNQLITALTGRSGGNQAAGVADGSHATRPHREGQNQEIQTVGRLDSGCSEQDCIPQVDDKQTAVNVHQELRKSRTVRFLDQGRQNQVCGYCICCGHARGMEAQADHTFGRFRRRTRRLYSSCSAGTRPSLLRLEQGTRSFIRFLVGGGGLGAPL